MRFSERERERETTAVFFGGERGEARENNNTKHETTGEDNNIMQNRQSSIGMTPINLPRGHGGIYYGFGQ